MVKAKISSFYSKKIRSNMGLYIMFLPVFIYYIIFHYVPMYGLQIAFKEFIPTQGIFGSRWVGFDNFITFFNSYNFSRLLLNTFGLSMYQLVVSFPFPIMLALMVNEVNNKRFKKLVQTVTYAPNFISIVVLAAMLLTFLSPRTGIINYFIKALGGEGINFMGNAQYFKTIFVFSGIWQNAGFSSIIYLAVLSGIDLQLYEAAIIDGCNKVKKIWYIDIPGIIPTAVILLILNVGRMMNVGFQKVLLMQNPLNMSASDVIETYVYRVGLVNAQYSYSAAIGLFNNLINLILLLTVNKIARKISETSLW